MLSHIVMKCFSEKSKSQSHISNRTLLQAKLNVQISIKQGIDHFWIKATLNRYVWCTCVRTLTQSDGFISAKPLMSSWCHPASLSTWVSERQDLNGEEDRTSTMHTSLYVYGIFLGATEVYWLGFLTIGKEVPGLNPTVGMILWVSVLASIASPHPGVKGYQTARDGRCVF
jgi:hypothetical protein